MRKNYLIYFMQTTGILLVVLGHSFYQNMYSPVVHWIYSFHMPLFFFLSGYLLKYTAKKDIHLCAMRGRKGFVFKKAYRLLLPYVVISSLFFVPKIWLGQLATRPLEASWDSYADMLFYPYHNVIGSFWFLPTLFFIYIAAVLAIKTAHWLLKDRHVHPLAVLIPLAVVHICVPIDKSSLLNLSGVAHFMVFFSAGYYACSCHIEEWTAPRARWLAPVTFVLSWLFLLADVDWLHRLSLLTSANGILMVMSLGQLYVRRGLHFLDPLYGATYTIYLFSFFPQFLTNQLLLHFVALPWQVTVVLSFVTGYYIPLLLYRWMKRYPTNTLVRIFRFISGQAVI